MKQSKKSEQVRKDAYDKIDEALKVLGSDLNRVGNPDLTDYDYYRLRSIIITIEGYKNQY